ncbi:MAG: GntR family transcriptional regulator [Clostridia bacterium]|nr:GntR family transcriptional regulator [Clostridia bacterium]
MVFTDHNRDYSSLSEKVYHHLREGITEGRYQSGEFLVESRIAEELGVSRTPVREAIKQLELEDLVVYHPNKGVSVKGFSTDDFDDTFKIRLLLEGQAAAWAAERITEPLLVQLQEILELMEFYTKKEDSERLARLDNSFHEILYEACESRTLRNILATLHQNSHMARQSSLTSPVRARQSFEEHKEIYQALSQHDADAAKAYIERHITGAAEYNKR